MKQYTCTKTVKARPCNRNEAEVILSRTIQPVDDSNEGYLIEYADGYLSWSPAKAFEEGYTLTETYIDRMKHELTELRKRIVASTNYLYRLEGEPYKDADLDTQLSAMRIYASTLKRRLYAAAQNEAKARAAKFPKITE